MINQHIVSWFSRDNSNGQIVRRGVRSSNLWFPPTLAMGDRQSGGAETIGLNVCSMRSTRSVTLKQQCKVSVLSCRIQVLQERDKLEETFRLLEASGRGSKRTRVPVRGQVRVQRSIEHCSPTQNPYHVCPVIRRDMTTDTS